MSLAVKEERYIPATRVYQHTRSSVVNAPSELPQIGTGTEKQPKKNKKLKLRLSAATAAKLIGVSLAVFAAAVAIVVIAGYSRVDQQHAKINEIKKLMAASESRIAELEVELECAVCVESAIETAKEAGMIYPSASQIRYIE